MITLIFVLKFLLCGVFTLFFCLCLFLYHQHKKYDHLPGPKRSSFFGGNIIEARKARKDRGVIIHQIWSDLAKEYKPFYVFWFFYKPVLMITDADLVREILVTRNMSKDPFGYGHFAEVFGQRFLGTGLLSDIDEEAWEKKRHIFNPAFHRKNLQDYLHQFNWSCDVFLEKLADVADGKTEVRMADELVRVALDAIAKVAFDLELDSIKSPKIPFSADCMQTAMEGMVESFRNPFMKYFINTYKYQNNVIEAIRKLRAACQDVIEGRIELVKKEGETRNDILSHILMLSKDFPDMEELIDHFITFIVGGQETISNHMAFTLMGIAKNPEVEKKVLAEIDEVLGSRQNVKYEDLHELKYLEQVMKEALRLHPPTPAITRYTKKETTIAGYRIPADTSIMVNAHVLQHKPEYWDDPEKFDPERFNPETGNKHHHYAYFPFSIGAHHCIGQFFAQFETKVVLARFLQSFKMSLLPGQSLKAIEQMTLRPKDGLKCTLTYR